MSVVWRDFCPAEPKRRECSILRRPSWKSLCCAGDAATFSLSRHLEKRCRQRTQGTSQQLRHFRKQRSARDQSGDFTTSRLAAWSWPPFGIQAMARGRSFPGAWEKGSSLVTLKLPWQACACVRAPTSKPLLRCSFAVRQGHATKARRHCGGLRSLSSTRCWMSSLLMKCLPPLMPTEQAVPQASLTIFLQTGPYRDRRQRGQT
mmetsp:Transcript_81537/g.113304  ORF Transcript_81537/g.113304 Transcript_81537/m.113304 type:complete len:204 (-) Transcript_81537:812-1423(-)